ncbi:MAG: Preprotein translocase, SecE subunit [Candidatus Peregrinibacteria bacterium GW2011_GWA2_47_7]|nr:MAG: Preprotein translocase, SecE subunit [Candidatus Peregrinibacteria bacterium GW2011_GWA2_47_7]
MARGGLFRNKVTMESDQEKGIKNYFVNSFRELSKVTWPTRNQAITMSLIVVVFVFISAMVIAGVDFSFNTLYTFFLSLAQ